MWFAAPLLLGWLAGASGPPPAAPAARPAGLVPSADPAALADLGGLARLRAAGTSALVFLPGSGEVEAVRPEGPRALAECEGPGVLQSVWVAPGEGLLRLRVVADGETVPGLDGPLAGIGRGTAAGLPTPLAGTALGGDFSFVPVFFRRHLRVEVAGGAPSSYRVAVARPGAPCPGGGGPATPATVAAAATAWSRPDELVPDSASAARYPVETAARGSVAFLLPAGPLTVRSLEIKPAPGTADTWRAARLRLAWEAEEPAEAGFDVPLGLAFATPRNAGRGATVSLLASASEEAFVVRWPMPYRTTALLHLDTPAALSGTITVRHVPGVAADDGYFRGLAWPTAGDEPAKPRSPLKLEGRGHLAGLVYLRDGPVLAAGSEALAILSVDGRAVGPLAVALGAASGRSGGGRAASGSALGSLDAGDRSPAGALVFRWLAADPVPFEHSASVGEKAEGVGAGLRGGMAPERVALFWYSERPGPGRPRR